MREIWLEVPRVTGDRIDFAWRVEPPSLLYKRSTFYLRFPPSIDPGEIPERLRWTILLLCLHGQWPLLRPCRIHLPVRLGVGESEFWSRLLDASVVTLEAHRGGEDTVRTIEIVEHGEPLADVPLLPERGRCAAAFSGGKDSLLQAGLLSELTQEVLLVTTTSPMPPLHDHETPRRRQVLREIVARRPNVTLVEIESDLRSGWKNDFPPVVGYQVAVNEVTDTFLYLSSLIAVAWVLGATHLFLASEAEVQENAEIAGKIVQHPHAMYSVVTQSAVSTLLAREGLRWGSLISPLRSVQVQQLLWKRYGDLSDLQYSCWRVQQDDAACSGCSQCLRIAFAALAAGEMPQRMGIDLVKLMAAMGKWAPRLSELPSVLPGDRVAADLHAQTVRSIVATPVLHFAEVLGRGRRLFTPRGLLAVGRFARLRRRLSRLLRAERVGPEPGYRPAYLEDVDALVRDAVGSIYGASFAPEDCGLHEPMRRRAEALTRWITEPLERDALAEGVA